MYMNPAQKEYLKTVGLYCAAAALAALNAYMIFELLAATKSYTVKERKARQLEAVIDKDLKLIRSWKEEEHKLRTSRIAREKRLVENYSITLHPYEKILTIPPQYVGRQPLSP